MWVYVYGFTFGFTFVTFPRGFTIGFTFGFTFPLGITFGFTFRFTGFFHAQTICPYALSFCMSKHPPLTICPYARFQSYEQFPSSDYLPTRALHRALANSQTRLSAHTTTSFARVPL